MIKFIPNLSFRNTFNLKIMRKLYLLPLLLFHISALASFNDYFFDKTLRFDYYHAGNAEKEYVFFDEMLEEPFWGGSKTNLIDTFDYGNYKFEVVHKRTGQMIYSRGYSSLFAEWQYTPKARKTSKAFSESIVMPYPKDTVMVYIFSRDNRLLWNRLFEYEIAPGNYFIVEEQRQKFDAYKAHYNGKPENSVDIVIIPDGYTANEMEKFKKDCDRFTNYLLDVKPFNKNKDRFNIYGVLAPSVDSGPDIPGKDTWKNTVVNSSFFTFDSERYLMTINNKDIRNLAANAPYDQIYILVNTDKYGGGGIFNFYSTCSSDHADSKFVFTHEFGHAFAGLADEYVGKVNLEDFYCMDKEPWEPNITTLFDFKTKWKHLVDKGTPIPTPVKEKYKKTVGAYEGGGYVEEGIYRPMMDCSMNTVSYDNFCPVCCEAIQKMIDFYCK